MHCLQFSLCALLFSILIPNGAPGASKVCTISFPGNIPEKGEPVYLKPSRDGSLNALQPTGAFTSLELGESLAIFCPGDDGEKLQTVKCSRDFDLTKYTCSGSVTADVAETEEQCSGGRGKWFKVGLPLPGGTFHTIYRTCFDREKLTPLYSFHILNGKAVGYHVKQSRGSFRTAKGIYGKVRINELYKTHISRFKKIFGHNQKFFRKPLHYLARGHLSPEVDFTFGTEQHATEIYINTAPQFQSINQGNWLRVENHVRNLAKALQEDVSVVTGILGLLRLRNKRKGTEHDIYLGEDVIPVPNIFWKAVFRPKTTEAIVFVSSNNPHEGIFDPGCTNVCDEAGFGDGQHQKQNFANHTIGLTICCKLEEFVGRNNVFLPEELNYKTYKKLLKLPGQTQGSSGSHRKRSRA